MLIKPHNFFGTINSLLNAPNVLLGFGISLVKYLGHINGQVMVRVKPKNIVVMQEWPHPQTLKRLHGFLCLMGYYMRFVKNYGNIETSLENLIKKISLCMEPGCRTNILIFKIIHVQHLGLSYS